MAEIVFGFGTSHTPMLNAQPEDWLHNFRQLDEKRSHRDKDGHPASYADLLTKADPRAQTVLNEAAAVERHARAQVGLQQVRDGLASARLDALIVIGDDQNEMFGTDNLPAILVCRGATIPNTPRHLSGPPRPEWNQRATAAFYNDPARDYPVDEGLADHLIASLSAADFDLATADRVNGEGEGHAVAFIHRRLMGAEPVPVVPVFLTPTIRRTSPRQSAAMPWARQSKRQ